MLKKIIETHTARLDFVDIIKPTFLRNAVTTNRQRRGIASELKRVPYKRELIYLYVFQKSPYSMLLFWRYSKMCNITPIQNWTIYPPHFSILQAVNKMHCLYANAVVQPSVQHYSCYMAWKTKVHTWCRDCHLCINAPMWREKRWLQGIIDHPLYILGFCALWVLWRFCTLQVLFIITWYYMNTSILLVENQVILNRITGFMTKNILKCTFKVKMRRVQCAWCVWRACVSKALPQMGNTVPYYLFDYGNMENINLNITWLSCSINVENL